MNKSFSSIENLKTHYQNSIERYENLKNAWQAVTLNKTKAGAEFKTLSRNFNNAKITVKYYGADENQKSITVYARSKRAGYTSDSIDIFTGSYPTYELLTVPEISEKIQKRIEQCERYIQEYKSALENIGAMVEFLENTKKLLSNIENGTIKRDAREFLRNYHF